MLTPEQERECKTLKSFFVQRAGMTQKDFAKKYGFGTPANLGQYLNARRPLNVTIAAKLAKLLDINIADFSTRLAIEADKLGIDSGNVHPKPCAPTKKIPVLAFVQAGLLTGNGQLVAELAAIDAGDYIDVDADMPDGSFALTVKGNSMIPVFVEGDIVVIDPTVKPLPGDYVVASRISSFSNDVETTLKKFRPRGFDEFGNEVFELVPLNDDYATINSERERCRVIGVVVEHRRKYRRH